MYDYIEGRFCFYTAKFECERQNILDQNDLFEYVKLFDQVLCYVQDSKVSPVPFQISKV